MIRDETRDVYISVCLDIDGNHLTCSSEPKKGSERYVPYSQLAETHKRSIDPAAYSILMATMLMLDFAIALLLIKLL